MKSPQTQRFERIRPSEELIMPPSPPYIQPHDIPNPNDPVLSSSSSPPAVSMPVSEASVSSPHGVPPIPVASSSPIPSVTSRSSSQCKVSPVPHPAPLTSSKAVPSVSQTISSNLIPSIQEELGTPKGKEQQEMKINKPNKKKSLKPNVSSKVPRRLTFSTNPKPRQSKTRRAGLVMSVARVLARLKAGRYSRRVGVTGAVYLAAVLEYLVAEVLELAGNCASFFRKKRVFPRCIQLSLLHDKELNQLTRGVIVPQGGVRPYIHPVLLGKMEGQAVTGQGEAGSVDQMTVPVGLAEEAENEVLEEDEVLS
eukprot:GFUD01034873.1.p1 GENE.GFUD01034873.1~~GFUD01034873.1.p1  ORF type:complete len:310 (-),score=89.67 GFUD01034873.1:120-1049(-)